MLTTPDHDDAVTSLPTASPVGPKPRGFYLDCDPASGRAGTVPRAEEFNELILNLRQLLDAAAVPYVKMTPAMLQTALFRLFAGAHTSVVATQTLSPDAAGIVFIDATAVDIVITLPSAKALPIGAPTLQFVRLDTSSHDVTIKPASGDAMRLGIAHLDDTTPLILRSDGTATWFSLTASGVIARARTIQVATTGVAQPTDPLGGTPFNSLASALAWLSKFRITTGTVTIQIAAGSYVQTLPTFFVHPDMSLIFVQGAGSTTTTLQCNACDGIRVLRGAAKLSGVRIQSDGLGAAPTNGISCFAGSGILHLADVNIQAFRTNGIQVGNGVEVDVDADIIVNNNLGEGVFVYAGGMLLATGTVTAQTNGGIANIRVSGYASFAHIETSAGARGLSVEAGGVCDVNVLNVQNAMQPTMAVQVLDGGILRAIAAATPNIWQAWTGATWNTFYAFHYGAIFSGKCMGTGNRGTTSPAINTLGNIQSYIEAT